MLWRNIGMPQFLFMLFIAILFGALAFVLPREFWFSDGVLIMACAIAFFVGALALLLSIQNFGIFRDIASATSAIVSAAIIIISFLLITLVSASCTPIPSPLPMASTPTLEGVSSPTPPPAAATTLSYVTLPPLPGPPDPTPAPRQRSICRTWLTYIGLECVP